MHTQFTAKRLKKFISYYKPHRRIFAMDMTFAALSAVAVLLFPLVSGKITELVMGGWDAETVRAVGRYMLLLAVLAVVRMVSNVIYAYFGHAMGAKMEETMRDELFVHYEELSFHFHAKHDVGQLMTVLSNDLSGMTELFHHGPEDLLMTVIKFGGAFVILMAIDWRLTVFLFALLPVMAVISIVNDRRMEQALLRSKSDRAEMNSHLEDVLSGIRTVKAFGAERDEARRFHSFNDRYTGSQCRYYKIEAIFYEVMGSFPQILTMLTICAGGVLIGLGRMDIPVLVTFLLYVGTLAEPIQTMLNFMRLYEEGKSGFIRYMEMLEVTPAVAEPGKASDLPAVELLRVRGEICFEDVSFHYPDAEENVLEHLSFTVASGESVAFAGASGIGKTTVSMLAARFYDVTGGRITLDGVDLRQLSNRTLRENIGIVQQEVIIFNGTIRDNIRFGRPAASDAEVEWAAVQAGIDGYIRTLPMGYDTLVGTKGITLSGGQRQRISIARLFLKNPKILILDEATSALDYESEQLVQRALEKLMQGRTSIIIAHRLSTIRNVDRIYLLGGKSIVESGSHAQLIAQNGEYAHLCDISGITQ